MDIKQAQNIVRDTLQNTFDKVRFTHFIKELLNHIEESPFIYRGNLIPDAYDKFISSFERIGKYTDGENKLDILIVNLKKETSIERARAMQRNFIAWYLNGSRGGELKDAALVAFVSPNRDDWRFSLVKMDYKFEEGKGGRIRAKEEFTPARRWSFLVGKNESSHTAQSQLAPIIADDTNNPTLKQLEEAFNIEVVTKEFFEKYRELFHSVQEHFDKILKENDKIRAEFVKKKVGSVDFSKKFLGQIVFLYFLQKKGWFGVERDADWGTGPKNFLRLLFEQKIVKYDNFFNDILEPLFYEALNKERDDDFYSKLNCKIPFLNGELFDPIKEYDWVHTDILLSNDIFSNKERNKEGDIGAGILDVFDRYNFTVKEDEPLEKDVAIDPEMLGKVFENLLEVKDRKSKGTYYTPREIVHYMCQESLINYLTTECKDKVSENDIRLLIQFGESAVEHEAIIGQKGKETATYYHKLPESIRNNAEPIDKSLANIRVCDPAIGSGAFPVGMMNEVIRTRNALTNFIKNKEERTVYEFKRHAIQHCLYGVDIDLAAVEIAKLRLWLSLVVDEDDIKKIKPLPNLDFRIVQGNSLLGVKRSLFNREQFDELEKLKPLYFDETNLKKKYVYKKRVDALIKEISNNNQNFDFEIYFSEVFHEKKGFDVVIANPPYVSYGLRGGQKMANQEKEYLKRAFPNSAEYKISLYAVFMDKAIQLSKPTGGLQTFIVPDSFLLGRYFSRIRKYILEVNEIIYILLLPYSVFEATVGYSVVYLFQRKQKINEKHKLTAKFAENNDAVRKGDFLELSYQQAYFQNLKFNRFRLFFDKAILEVVSKIEKNSEELNNAIRFSSGLISKTGQKNIISEDKKGEKWLPGIISGSEIKKYAVFSDGHYILYDKAKIKSGFENVDYSNEKLFVRQTGDSLICAVDNTGLLALNNVHIGNLLSKKFSVRYVASILNSRLLNFYYKAISLEAGRVMAQTDIETIESLPIKVISAAEQDKFIEIVDKILHLTRSKDYLENKISQTKVREYEKQIDQLVYKLYDLTSKEIKIVEGSNKKN